MAHSDLDVYELGMLMHSHTLGVLEGTLRLDARHAIGTLRLEPVNTRQEVK